MLPSTIFKDLHSVFFPGYCLICEKIIARGELCLHCKSRLIPVYPPGRCDCCFSRTITGSENLCALCTVQYSPVRRLRYLWSYRGYPRFFIRAMKYRPSQKLADYGGRLLREALDDLFPSADWDLLCPVPARFRSLRRRGFNQCERIARALALPLPIFSNGLSMKSSANQAGLQRLARIRNVEQVFTADSTKVAGKSILLLDDVVTTAATITAASLALLLAGARSVDVLALARSESSGQSRNLLYRRLVFPRLNV